MEEYIMVNGKLDEKQIGIRLKDPALQVLDRRVDQLNNLAPESKVTHGTLVKYAVEEYARKLDRKDVEITLTFPYENRHLDTMEHIEKHPYVDMEDLTEHFSFDETKELVEAFEVITRILKNKENIEHSVVKGWKTVTKNLKYWYEQDRAGIEEANNWANQYE